MRHPHQTFVIAGEAAATSNLNADTLVWASSTGAYAGLTLNGSIIKARTDYSAAYYGKAGSAADIIFHGEANNRQAEPLRRTPGTLG